MSSLLLWSDLGFTAPSGIVSEIYSGRTFLVDAPEKLPPIGARALVVVLHGGLGNANRIVRGLSESGLNMNEIAEKSGFIVAYLNGTPVTRQFGAQMLGWNAGGGCCGVPAANNVDDVAYISSAVHHLACEYGVNSNKVYVIGHSNGGMMAERLMCETNLFTAGISVAGPLNLQVRSCPLASGKRILAIHGTQDQNVPVIGGRGTKGISGVTYMSEQYTEQVFTASHAEFHLQVLPGAAHQLGSIDGKIKQLEGISLPLKAARFFGIAK